MLITNALIAVVGILDHSIMKAIPISKIDSLGLKH